MTSLNEKLPNQQNGNASPNDVPNHSNQRTTSERKSIWWRFSLGVFMFIISLGQAVLFVPLDSVLEISVYQPSKIIAMEIPVFQPLFIVGSAIFHPISIIGPSLMAISCFLPPATNRLTAITARCIYAGGVLLVIIGFIGLFLPRILQLLQ